MDDEREAFVIRDLHSRMMHVYPVTSKSTEDTIEALQHFKGDHEVKLFYSDGAPELHAACRALGITHEVSTPGQSQNNGRADKPRGPGRSSSVLTPGRPTGPVLDLCRSVLLPLGQHGQWAGHVKVESGV